MTVETVYECFSLLDERTKLRHQLANLRNQGDVLIVRQVTTEGTTIMDRRERTDSWLAGAIVVAMQQRVDHIERQLREAGVDL